MSLEQIEDDPAFEQFLADPKETSRVLGALAKRHGWTDSPKRYTQGSTLVAAFGDAVVKLFAPFDRDLAEGEGRALAHLQGRLSLPSPELLDTGDFETAPYLVMSRLPGVDASTIWSRLRLQDKLRIAGDVGRWLKELHCLESPEGHYTPDWQEWVSSRRANLVERQRAKGADETLVAGIDPFLDSVELSCGTKAFLHTEVMQEHVKVSEASGSWRATGVFDFEPSMVGPTDYEMSSVGVFFARGEPEVLRACLVAYGYARSDLDADLSRRWMAMTLLHRYANLPFFMRATSVKAQTIEDLHKAWFSFD